MQISIYKIFGTVKSLYSLMLVLAILIVFTVVSEYTSFYKLTNLQNEKKLATDVYNLSRDDLDYANIQYRGQNALLRHEGNALLRFYNYDFINKYSGTENYHAEIAKLQQAVDHFNVASGKWYTQDALSEKELQSREKNFDRTYNLLIDQINTIISKNRLYEEKRFHIQMGLIIILLIVILFSRFWAARRLNQIEADIKTLNIFESKDTASYSTLEAESISKHTGRTSKAPSAQNPAYLDSASGITNDKGFMHEYSEKKSQKLGNYTAVCLFSIDKLTEMEMQYSQDFIDALMKKVGFILSLYRQHNDVIGRLDHNQFAIFLSRQDKTSAINDCELVRKSIEETPFKTSDGKSITVTLSGGFVQKMSSQNLDEVITKAGKVLSMSIQHGGNRIAQLRDKSTALK